MLPGIDFPLNIKLVFAFEEVLYFLLHLDQDFEELGCGMHNDIIDFDCDLVEEHILDKGVVDFDEGVEYRFGFVFGVC